MKSTATAASVVAGIVGWAASVCGGDLTVDDLTVNGKLEVTSLGSGSAATNGLILYYSCTTSNSSYVLDESGNNYTGTVSGATWTSSGISGGGYDFDGSDDSIALPNDLSSATNATVSLWIKADSLPLAQNGFFSVKDNNGTGTSGCMYFRVKSNGALSYYYTGDMDSAAGVITAGTWYHVASVVGDDGLSVYVDGVSTLTNAATTGFNDLSTGVKRFDLALERYNGGTYYFWDGKIDEVRIYNRSLSSNEIYQLYLYNRPGSSSPGVVRLNEGLEYCKSLGDIPVGAYTNGP